MKKIIFYFFDFTLLILMFAFFKADYAFSGDNKGAESLISLSDIHTKNKVNSFLNKSILFLENHGQYPEEVKFHTRIKNADLFFVNDGIVYSANSGKPASQSDLTPQFLKEGFSKYYSMSDEYHTFKMKFNGSNKNVVINGGNESVTKTNIFKGSSQKDWKTNLTNYNDLIYQNIYDGINVKYFNQSGCLKYDFEVMPHADPNKIKFKYEGLSGITTDKNGNLIIDFGYGKITEEAPKIYQDISGQRIEISGKYFLDNDKNISFELSSYDNNYPLIIDPDLLYSTYFGGSGDDKIISGLAINSSGDIFAAGMTTSPSLPSASGYDLTYNGSQDIFVFKFSSDLSQLKAVTYLGGSGSDGYVYIGAPLVIMPSGNIALTGYTMSSDFPTTPGVFGSGNTYGGAGDGFVSILDNNLTTLVASTYFGGSGADYAQTIAVDGSGNLYIGGTSTSTNFPHFSNSYQNANKGGYDVTLTKFDSDLSSILASTYIGGTGLTELPWATVIANGSIYLAGGTISTDFPVTSGAYDKTENGDRDVFILKMDLNLSTLQASTYLGSPEYEQALGMTADNSGNIYVVGDCRSANYPTTPTAFDKTYAGGSEIFISKLDGNLSTLLASTLLGGSGDESTRSIVVRSNGDVVIGGGTSSSDYSVSSDAIDNSFNGGNDGVITFLSNDLSTRNYSSFLGGSGDDAIQAIAFNGNSLYVAGYTNSTNFPVTAGAYDVTQNGGYDAFVSCISFAAGSVPVLISPPNNSTGLINPVTFVWNSVSGAVNYRLQVATDSLFSAIQFDTTTALTSKVRLLLSNTKYYWRLGAISPAGNTTWSALWRFTTVAGGLIPSVPMLMSPSSNSTNNPLTVSLTWSPVGTLYFRLQVATDSLFSKIFEADSLSSYTKIIGPLNPSTKYYWRVKTGNFFGESSWSDVWNFTTILGATVPNAPILLQPANGATNLNVTGSTNTQIEWNAANSADKYFVQVATDSLFNAIVINDSTASTSYRISGVLNGLTKYFWKVRAKNSSGFGLWSVTWSFTTDPTYIISLTLSSPPNNSVNLSNPISFTWNSGIGGEAYNLQIASDSGFKTIVFDTTTLLTNLTKSFPNGTKYYWRVLKVFIPPITGGTLTGSATWNFTTADASLNTPTLLAPANNALDVPTDMMLGWNAVSGATNYHLQIAKDVEFKNIVLNDSMITSTERISGTLLNNTNYFWRVRAKNLSLTGGWSEIRNFKTIALKLGSVFPISPADQSANQPISISFIWNKVTDASYYKFQLAQDSLFTLLIRNDSVANDTSITVSSLINGQKYFWRVMAESNFGIGNWSALRSFTTIPLILEPPQLLNPNNNSTNVQTNAVLIWQPNYTNPVYRVQIATDTAFTKIFRDSANIETNSAMFSNLQKSTKYFWRVNVAENGLTSDWSEIWSFTTILKTSLFKDPNLETAIRQALNIPEAEITIQNMALLTAFDAGGKNISDLTGLEFAANLTDLRLTDNSINDINPILNLKNIQYLNLSNNKNLSLKNLVKLTNLYHLKINYIKIVSLDSLKNNIALRYLSLTGDSISDLNPLTNLNNLDTLYADVNNIQTLPVMDKLTKISVLGLSHNQIKNVAGLNKLITLKQLMIDHNSLTDINGLSNLSAIEDISLEGNQLKDTSLTALYNLTKISNKNIVTNISGADFYGYLDLRNNLNITRFGILALDAKLPLIDYPHIVWDSIGSTVIISGKVMKGSTPVDSVKMSLTGDMVQTTYTNSQGFYSFTVIKNGTYLLTPSKDNIKFDPLSSIVENIASDLMINFSINDIPIMYTGINVLNFSAIKNSANPVSQTFRVLNTGLGKLNFVITKDASWMDVSPLTGSDSALITVSPNTTNLQPGTYQGNITITDHNASNSPVKVAVNYNIQSITLPTFRNQTSNYANFNSDQIISFTLGSGDIPDRVMAFYRIGGAGKYDSLATAISGSNYTFTIPKSKITERGIDYFVKGYYGTTSIVFQEGININSSIRVRIPQISPVQKLERNVYSMFSTIEITEGSLFDQLVANFGSYNNKIWRAFKWQLTKYEEILNSDMKFDKGDGFWLITNTDNDQLTITNLLSTPTGTAYKLQLQPGWNQIGNPFLFPVSLADVSIPSNVENTFWKWDETIQNYKIETSQIEPMKGYLVKNNNTGTVEMAINPVSNETPVLSVKPLLNNEWVISIKINSGLKEINYLKFGTLNASSEEFDKNDISKAPESPEGAITPKAYFKTTARDQVELSGDFRGLDSSGYKWIVNYDNIGKGETVNLEFTKTGDIPSGYNLELIYGNKVLDLNKIISSGSYSVSYTQNDDNYFTLVAGSKTYIVETTKDGKKLTDYSLSQNYPNPFNPETNIEFYLPQDNFVKLLVFNTLGSEIETLVSENMSRGVHTVKFSPKNKISSGIYFYRIDAGNYSSIKKMLYLR
jgi:hypothetical protein